MTLVPAVTLQAALFWGAVTAAGIVVGAFLGVYAPLSHRSISRAMSLGAGLLLAAAAVELAAEVTRVSPVVGVAALLVGAAAFSTANAWLSRRGAKDRKRCGECVAQPTEAEVPSSGLAIAMGTAMDAVPEALVLGISLHAHGPNAALIAAITLGNLPEAMSASAGMRAARRSVRWILGLWLLISAATTVLTGVGYAFAGVITAHDALLLQAFGAGALLAMVAETLLPEAAHEGPAFSGLTAAVGFGALLLISAHAH